MKPRHKTKAPTFDADGYQTNLKDLNGTPLPDLRKVRAISLRDGARRTPAVNRRADSPSFSS